MERLTAAVLNKKWGNIILPDAQIRVPPGWYQIVDTMLGTIAALTSDVRPFLMVQGVAISEDGMLSVSMYALTGAMTEHGWQTVQGIVADARAAAAWTCVRESNEAWIVAPPKGRPRPLCPDCQRAVGLNVECYSA